MPTLEIESQRGSMRKIELTEAEYVLGRDTSLPIVLDDHKVSRRHARLSRRDGAYYIEDLGSSNGVAVAGALIETATRVEAGVPMIVGPFTLVLREATAPAAAAAAATTPAITLQPRGGPASAAKSFGRGKVIVGRGKDADWAIDDQSLSRRHAALHVGVDKVVVEDLRSSNGCFINEVRIARETLNQGDVLRFGSVPFEVTLHRPRAIKQRLLRLPHASTRALLRRLGAVVAVCLSGLLSFAALEQRVATRRDGRPLPSRPEAAQIAKVQAALDTGRSQAGHKAWEPSIAAYHQALALDPVSVEARSGLAAAESGRDQGAWLQAAQRALDQRQPQQALFWLARIEAQGPYGAAAAELLEAAQAATERAQLEQGQAACRRREFIPCQQEAATLLVFVPKSVAARALMQEAEDGLRRAGKPSLAWDGAGQLRPNVRGDTPVREAVLRYAAGDVETAILRLRQLTQHPGARPALADMATLLRRKADGDAAYAAGNIPQAASLWEAALQRDSNLLGDAAASVVGAEVGWRLGNACLRLGQQSFDRGAYAKAFASWRRGLQAAPTNAAIAAQLARLEGRASSLLSDLNTLPNLDASACARLQDVLDMTPGDSVTHRAAQRKMVACTTRNRGR